eukprot:PLAT12539.2.p1 GENE.PLAT12539.2~~PLAT12539.2.p1  ORF type:complete len:422 (-),score=153.78 PLAT12539.2:92-1303(-)
MHRSRSDGSVMELKRKAKKRMMEARKAVAGFRRSGSGSGAAAGGDAGSHMAGGLSLIDHSDALFADSRATQASLSLQYNMGAYRRHLILSALESIGEPEGGSSDGVRRARAVLRRLDAIQKSKDSSLPRLASSFSLTSLVGGGSAAMRDELGDEDGAPAAAAGGATGATPAEVMERRQLEKQRRKRLKKEVKSVMRSLRKSARRQERYRLAVEDFDYFKNSIPKSPLKLLAVADGMLPSSTSAAGAGGEAGGQTGAAAAAAAAAAVAPRRPLIVVESPIARAAAVAAEASSVPSPKSAGRRSVATSHGKRGDIPGIHFKKPVALVASPLPLRKLAGHAKSTSDVAIRSSLSLPRRRPGQRTNKDRKKKGKLAKKSQAVPLRSERRLFVAGGMGTWGYAGGVSE